jgi:hypothetical protein
MARESTGAVPGTVLQEIASDLWIDPLLEPGFSLAGIL